MTAPHIIGWAHTRFGKSESPDVESLIAEVSVSALADAGLDAADVDIITVGVFNNGFSRQGFEEPSSVPVSPIWLSFLLCT